MKRLAALLMLLILLLLALSAEARSSDSNAQILLPGPGDQVSGLVMIMGTANVPRMQGYTLEYRPSGTDQPWALIIGPVNKSVVSCALGMWDTSLVASGTYELRLTVSPMEGDPLQHIVSPVTVGTGGADIRWDEGPPSTAHAALLPTDPAQVDTIRRVLEAAFPAEIEALEPGLLAEAKFPALRGSFDAYGYDMQSSTPPFTLVLESGALPDKSTRDTGVIVSAPLAQNLGVSVGSGVTLEVNGSRADLIVIGIARADYAAVWLDGPVLARLSGQPQGYFVTFADNGISPLKLAGAVLDTLAENGITVELVTLGE